MKNRILKILFLVWVVLWGAFTARELFVKGNISDYKALLARPLEGKHAYLMGDDLYGFVRFCNEKTPEDATFRLEGLDAGSIEARRAVYYFYPRLTAEKPDFIFVYDKPRTAVPGYALFARMDPSRYILKKAR